MRFGLRVVLDAAWAAAIRARAAAEKRRRGLRLDDAVLLERLIGFLRPFTLSTARIAASKRRSSAQVRCVAWAPRHELAFTSLSPDVSEAVNFSLRVSKQEDDYKDSLGVPHG